MAETDSRWKRRKLGRFIGLQPNGFADVFFTDPKLTPEMVVKALEGLVYGAGYSLVCPTMITASRETIAHCMGVFKDVKADATWGPHIHCVHVEMAGLKYAGAHPPEHVRVVSADEFAEWQEKSGNLVGLFSFDPAGGLNGEGLKLVDHIASTYHGDGTPKVRMQFAHTDAPWEVLRDAATMGVGGAVHLGNGIGVGGLLHRTSNPIIDILALDTVSPWIIPDGYHVNDRFVKTVLSARQTEAGQNPLVWTMDEAPCAGGTYGDVEIFGGCKAHHHRNGMVSIRDGWALAGSGVLPIVAANWLMSHQTLLGLDVDEIFAGFERNALGYLGITGNAHRELPGPSVYLRSNVFQLEED